MLAWPLIEAAPRQATAAAVRHCFADCSLSPEQLDTLAIAEAITTDTLSASEHADPSNGDESFEYARTQPDDSCSITESETQMEATPTQWPTRRPSKGCASR